MTSDQTVFEMASEYVACLDSQPNGWGQHIHRRFGQSHYILRYMNVKFGAKETQDAITLEFKHRIEQHDQTTTTTRPEQVPTEPSGTH